MVLSLGVPTNTKEQPSKAKCVWKIELEYPPAVDTTHTINWLKSDSTTDTSSLPLELSSHGVLASAEAASTGLDPAEPPEASAAAAAAERD